MKESYIAILGIMDHSIHCKVRINKIIDFLVKARWYLYIYIYSSKQTKLISVGRNQDNG